MPEKFCSGCRKYYPDDKMKRKRLRGGGIRLICVGCIERSKARSDVAALPAPPEPADSWRGITPQDLEQLTHRALPAWVAKLVQDVETVLREKNT